MVGTRGSACPKFLAVCVLALLLLPGCLVMRRAVVDVTPEATAPTGEQGQRVKKATKAHLADGSLVMFAKGYTLAGGVLRGAGQRYDLTRSRSEPVSEIPLKDVVVLESYRWQGQLLRSVAGNLVGVWLSYLGLVTIVSNAPLMP